MAKVKVMLRIEDADSPQQAVEVAREIIAMLKTRLNRTPHTVEGKVQIPCPDCGELMTVQDREIVCLACIAEWEREFDLDRVIHQVARQNRHGPQDILEALLM